MAGSKLKSNIKASTILEVIVSMVVIVIVFSVAMMIFSNVLRLSLSAKKLRAQALLDEAMLNATKNTSAAASSITVDDFRVDQEIKPYNGDSNLTEIDLTAFDQNQQKIAELKKVVITRP